MKLLLATQTETKMLNIQYLLKSTVVFAHTYEEFLSKLHDNIDTIGFTTKAVNLISTPSKFINLLRGINSLYGYKLVYFADDTDAITDYIGHRQKCYTEEAFVTQTEVSIVEALNRDEIKIISHFKEELSVTPAGFINLLQKFERNPIQFLEDVNATPKLLKDILTVAKDIHQSNSILARDTSRLHSEKLHLLELSTKISDENKLLNTSLATLEKINEVNYQALCAYKSRYDTYQSTLDTVIKHGIGNLEENLFSSIEVSSSTYPICVLYLKQVTHLKYLSSYIHNFLKILIDNRYIAKVLRVLPKNSTQALPKYSDHYNTSYGLDASTYSKYTKFIHLGNPDTILKFMVSNQLPIDILIVIDETAVDNQYCYGSSVVKYNLASSDEDLLEYNISLDTAIVNESLFPIETSDHSLMIQLARFQDFDKIKDSPQLIQVYYESLTLTKRLLNSVNTILHAE